MSLPTSARPPARLTTLLVWLGGGDWRDLGEPTERSSYLTTGLFVALDSVLACSVVGIAAAAGLPGWLFAVFAGLLVGLLGRTLASAPVERAATRSRRLLGDLAKGLVAVLIGILLGELAALALFAGAVNRELDSSLDTAGSSVTQPATAERLGALQADRTALDTQADAAAIRRDQALVVARCEYRPGPGCPSTRITGDPGRGPETTQAKDDLAAAEHDLVEATARRDQLTPGLDRDITAAREQLGRETEKSEALAAADTGLDARWTAMHSYTTHSTGPLLLRIAMLVLFALLNVLPLLLRRWRGETAQDRRVLARTVRDRAEEDADTAVAVSRAQLRAALELDRHRTVLASVHPPAAPERELDAAPERDLDAAPERVALAQSGNAALPVSARRGELARPTSNPLDLLPGPLPGAVRTITGLVRPFVPTPVVRLAGVAPRSIRMARGLWEEVEEFQLTLLHKRSVRLASDEVSESPGNEHPTTSVAGGSAEPEIIRVHTDVVTQPRPEAPPLAARPDPELAGRRRARLRTGANRELPPADDHN